LTTAVCGGRIL